MVQLMNKGGILKLMETNQITVNQKYGYARVNSKSQEDNSSLKSHTQELLQHGIPKDNIRIYVGSAANSQLYTYQYPFTFPRSYLSYQDR